MKTAVFFVCMFISFALLRIVFYLVLKSLARNNSNGSIMFVTENSSRMSYLYIDLPWETYYRITVFSFRLSIILAVIFSLIAIF